MTTVSIEMRSSEAELVQSWRLEQLRRSGYDEHTAALLAALRHVDLHVAVDLPSGGCPVETAFRILA